MYNIRGRMFCVNFSILDVDVLARAHIGAAGKYGDNGRKKLKRDRRTWGGVGQGAAGQGVEEERIKRFPVHHRVYIYTYITLES